MTLTADEAQEYRQLFGGIRRWLLEGLTEAQQAAVTHSIGPLLVAAGPGSGKTTVIVRRVAHLVLLGEESRSDHPTGQTRPAELAELRRAMAFLGRAARGSTQAGVADVPVAPPPAGGAGVDPRALLVVTFTKAAADSMKQRTQDLVGPSIAGRVTFGTFHALAYRILRAGSPERTLTVLDEVQQMRLIRQLMRQTGLNTDEETVLELLSEISRLRADPVPDPAFRPRSLHPDDFRRLISGYQETKVRRGLVDFDDLLHDALALLQTRSDLLASYRQRYQYVMVDEFQDTNGVQWELVRLLAAEHRNLCVVGDEDQSIYGWRGASPRFLLDFPQLFGGASRVTLDLNYRCSDAVVGVANRLIAQNRERSGKVIRAVKPAGAPVQPLLPPDTLAEAEAIVGLVRAEGGVPSDWAVIYRTNQQAHVIARVLEQAAIPYRVVGGLPNLHQRWQVQDVLAYLRAAVGDGGQLTQVINRPNRYVSRQVLQEAERVMARTGLDLLSAIAHTGLLQGWQLRPLEELDDHLRRLTRMTAPEAIGYVRRFVGYDDYLQEYCDRRGGDVEEMRALLSEVEQSCPREPLIPFLAEVDTSVQERRSGSGEGVTLLTCHAAKGLEFPNVVVAGCVERLMPHKSSDDREEERRLLYVAMTRAESRLFLSSPGSYGGRKATPSPFLREALGEWEAPVPPKERRK